MAALQECLTLSLENHSQGRVAIDNFAVIDMNRRYQKFILQKIRIGDVGIERGDVAMAFCRYVGIFVDQDLNLAVEDRKNAMVPDHRENVQAKSRYAAEITKLLENFARNMANSEIWVLWRKNKNDGFSFHDNIEDVARDLWEELVIVP